MAETTIGVREEGVMASASGGQAPMGQTVVEFLRGLAQRWRGRDALLFKPAFRYQRWSYAQL